MKTKEMCELNVIKVKQGDNIFYIAKIDSNLLNDLSRTYYLKLDKTEKKYYGNQRLLNKWRLNKIDRYLKYSGAIFPNSIILNLKNDYFIKIEDNKLIFTMNKDAFSIIDGQHRLAGLDYSKKNFEMPVAIFIGLSNEKIAEIFYTINCEQVRVNPSLELELKGQDNVKTPEVVATRISRLFAIDDESPWKEMISFGVGKDNEFSPRKIISLSSFASPIIDLIYNNYYFYELKEDFRKYLISKSLKSLDKINNTINFRKYEQGETKIFWNLYITDREEYIFKILLNYFNALKDILPNSWGSSNSILCKTTGYYSLMMLFKFIYKKCNNDRDFSYKYFVNILMPLTELDGSLNIENYGLGLYEQKNLFLQMYKLVFKHEYSKKEFQYIINE